MAIDGTIAASFVINDRRTNVGLSGSSNGVNIPTSRSPAITFTNGAGASAANIIFADDRTLGASPDDLDLAGVLADLYGGTLTFVRVKAIYIKNTGNASITVGADGTNPWATLLNSTGTLTLPASAWFVAATPDATGWAVTAGTGDILQVSGTNGQTYEIAILGASS